MSVTKEQFVQSLIASGLMSAAEFASFHDGLAPDRRPKDAEGVARELVRANKLTKFQAQAVYQGKIKTLVFGEYTVLDKLGQGGMGVVLKAEHRRMKRLVAVKMIAGAALKSPDAVKRFYREVEAAARLEHPNIVTAHDASEHEGVHYLVMQFVDGKDLGALVKQRGPLPIRTAADYVLQAARGLDYAHNHGIVHRDIKPSNLLLDPEGTIKILDMGLARIGGPAGEDDKDRLTASGEVMGTCDYMAPEQAFDTHTADARADIYSLGCTLYRLLTGKSPFVADTLVQILIAHREAPIPALCKARADVPAELDGIFQKMMAKRPEDRYQSMGEVVLALEGFMFWAAEELSPSPATTPQARADLTSLRPSAPSGTAVAAKKRAAAKREETFSRQAGETGVFLGLAEALLTAPRRNKPLAAAIGLGLLAVVGLYFLAVTIRVRHPDGKETSLTVPDGSTVTISDKGDVAVTLKAEGGRGKAEGSSVSPLPQAGEGPGVRAAPPLAIAPFDAKKAREHQEAWAKHLGVPVEITNSIGMKLVLIPPGEFDMGSSPEEQAWAMEAKRHFEDKRYASRVSSEAPRHRVKITKPFCLGMNQVTQSEYEKVMGVNPSAFTEKQMEVSAFQPPLVTKVVEAREENAKKKVAGMDTSRHPVETVNWEDAMEFCRRLSAMPAERAARRTYRLPTEAEWEHACRAGTTTRWYCGDDEAGLTDYAWLSENSGGMTHPVGEKKPNAWGLYDMFGNVYQWCADWYSTDYYKHSPPHNPTGPLAASCRVLRGHHMTSDPCHCRSAHRSFAPLAYRNQNEGFRVVAEIASQTDVGKQPTTPTAPVAPAQVNYGPNAPPPAVAPFDAKKAKEHQEAWATHLGVPVEMTNSIGMKLVLIPPGEFDMGSTPEEIAWALAEGKKRNEPQNYFDRVSDEAPRHRVKITKPFCMGVYPVTQGEYEKVIRGNPSAFTEKQRGPATFKPPLSDGEMKIRQEDLENARGKDTSRYPVETVTWEHAMEFCRRLSDQPAERAARRTYRLATEAEWEYACRAGTTTRWFCGDDEESLLDHAWFSKNADRMSHPVGQKKPNAWGLYDMHGGAWQWCSDWVGPDYYEHSPATDPGGPQSGSFRVVRGGWINPAPHCRSATRNARAPTHCDHTLGFRVVAEIDAQSAGQAPPDKQPSSAPPIPNPQSPIPPPAIAPFDAKKAREHQESWAKHLGVPVEETNSIGMKLVLIPPGEFDMGSTPEEIQWAMEQLSPTSKPIYENKVASEGPRHRVKITKPFYLGMYPVTQDEYEKIMGVNPSGFTEKQVDASWFKARLSQGGQEQRKKYSNRMAGKDTSRHPVETVSWNDAAEFCRKLSSLPAERATRRKYRLPSEAEWEYACRAGTTTRWYCGDDEAGLQEYGWYTKNSGHMTHPVGEKRPNAWNVFDMHGNAIQWCEDGLTADLDYYKHAPANDPVAPHTGSTRVARGGSHTQLASCCRSAARHGFGPVDNYLENFGLRVVMEIDVAAGGGGAKGESSRASPLPFAGEGPGVRAAPPPAVAPFDAKKAREHQEPAGTAATTRQAWWRWRGSIRTQAG